MTTKSKKCPACEAGILVGKPSREPMPFRHSPSVVPARAVDVPTCNACGAQFIDAKTAQAYDDALEESLAAHHQALLSNAVERLGEARLQRQWERRLGLSPGYFSRLKGGKDSSVPLTTLLALLAESPLAAWDHLDRVWTVVTTAPEPVSAPVVRLIQSVRFDAQVAASSIATAIPPRVKVVPVEALSQSTLPEAA